MYISNDCDRSCDVDDIAFLHQQFLCLGANCLDDGVRQQFLPVESLDTFVQIDTGYGSMRIAQSHGAGNIPGSPGIVMRSIRFRTSMCPGGNLRLIAGEG